MPRKATDHRRQTGGLRTMVFLFLKIKVVNHLGDRPESGVLDTGIVEQYLKRTQIAAMSKLTFEHVETLLAVAMRIASGSTNENFACGSIKRRISQADPIRSTLIPRRVTHVLPRSFRAGRPPPPLTAAAMIVQACA